MKKMHCLVKGSVPEEIDLLNERLKVSETKEKMD